MTGREAQRLARAALTLVLALAAPLAGQTDSGASDKERFDLLTKCQPLLLAVSVTGDEASKIRLTRLRVRTMAESRLRAARIYNGLTEAGAPVGAPALSVRVDTLDDGPPVVSFGVSLVKDLDDPVTGLRWGVHTWERSHYGVHGGDAGFVMQALSETLDRFILEYLRVNEAWC